MQSVLGNYSPARGGHAPSHLRDAFSDAVDAIEQWAPGEPEPIIYVGRSQEEWPVRKAVGVLWNCTDFMPEMICDAIDDMLPWLCSLRRRTYAAGARALLTHVIELDQA